MRSWAIIAAILIGIGWMVYARSLSPEAQIQKVTDQFVRAAVAGDLAAVEALVAPDAVVSASEWVERYKGLRYFSAQDAGRAPVTKELPNACGLEYMALGSAIRPDHSLQTHMLSFKKVDGKWKVYQSDGVICPNSAR